MITENRTNEPTPERWRKKPVEIEARRFSGVMELIDVEGLALWCGGTFKHDTGVGQEYKTYYWSIEIPTLEGTMRATPGDYIIKGVQGEFYPCKPDIFEQTYERAALVAAQGAARPEVGRLDLARHYWRSQGYDYDLHGQDGNSDYEMGMAVADAAQAALAAAQGAAPQAERAPKSSYISPSLPGMIRNLWKSDPSENSVRTALKLAGDLIQELIDLRAAPVLPSSPESPVQAFADWHERWWRNEPDTIQKANAQAAFFAGWDARGAVSVLSSSGVDEGALANLIHSTSVNHFGGLDPRVAPIIARAVVEAIGGESRGSR